jgi:transcriptional regulator with XRE-family HTH domain
MKQFKDLIKNKRTELNLTSKELSKLSRVSESLLSGLQSGTRRIGEKQAYRIASALGLEEDEHCKFVFAAMNESTQRLLESSRSYPVEILNFLPTLLRNRGIPPDSILNSSALEERIEISLSNGKTLSARFNSALF